MDYGNQTAGGSGVLVGHGGYLPGAAPTPKTLRDPQVAERATIQGALDEQTGALMELHKAISNLEERLQLVLVPPGPSNGNTAKQLDPSHILDRVRASNETLGVAIQRIYELTQRLQV